MLADDGSRKSSPDKAIGGTPRRTWSRSRREEFVHAAIEFLNGAGEASQLGIRQVASLVGKSPSAPLFHFPDRVTLLAAVAAEGFRQVAAKIREGNEASPSKRGPLEDLIAGALTYVDWAGDHPALFSVMYTPALAAGIDAIQSGDERFWRPVTERRAANSPAELSAREPEGRRRLAFQELHDAKIQTILAFMSPLARSHAYTVALGGLTGAELANAVITMADGLAWQRVNERQQTPELMRRHAERMLRFLVRGSG